MTFLFWNIYKRELQESIQRIVDKHAVDIVILAECIIDPNKLQVLLSSSQSDFHHAPSLGCRKIEIFTKFPKDLIPIVVEDDRMTIRQLKTSTMMQDILLAGLHFPSKNSWDESDQLSETPRYADLVRQAEKQVGHERTVLVGDFNMNPYERGMVNASGFNAVMSRAIAEKRSRVVQGREYPFFYNPMWGLSGDTSPGPAGTYHFDPSGMPNSYYWHIFDQVLIRPDLLECFDRSGLKVLDSDGEMSLLSDNGIPDKSRASDHLPLLFELLV